ncbi:MAG: SGNH/GDSL hydrolase family protein [Deltaproteobacteria bacterium]
MKSIKSLTFLLLATLGFLIPLSEVAIRLRKGALLDFQNTLYKPQFLQSNRFLAGYPEQYDPILGWVPQSQKELKANWGSIVKTREFGIRSNGRIFESKEQPILALGGSFTFGDQVEDNQTWPSYLEQLANRPILNAGVSGYGLDQIILRLADLLHKNIVPSKVVIGVTAQNVQLVSFSQRWGLNKPYFEFENSHLQLKNTPIQATEKYPRLGLVRSVLGHSYFFSVLLYRLAPTYWTAGLNYKFQSLPTNTDWREVSCALTLKLSTLLKEHHLKGLLVYQYEKDVNEIDLEVRNHINSCAKKVNLEFFDTYPSLSSLQKNDPQKYQSFFSWHMTAAGNAFIAKQIFPKLQNL